ncbi:MAG: three-Cys-motif partner protein TcmP [Tepidisphaeraceae bacterium]|jgi:three-Cys-motif partner protein
MSKLKFDKIGYWSEVKLDIVHKYATAYSTILGKQPSIRSHLYIDAFAGAGVHISKQTREFIPGSPLNALNVDPPFTEHHFIDLDGARTDNLRSLAGNRKDVHVYEGDCNSVLVDQVFPRARYQDYKRALCLLDPYALNLDWKVMETAGKMESIEIFLNFMVMDMNMNVLWRNPDKVDPVQADRMNRFWGDESWNQAAYSTSENLFGIPEKTDNEAVAQAFRERLKKVAGFEFVPDPMPMRNSTGAIVYYLFFASPNETGAKIVKEIFDTYRDRGSM